MLGIKEWLSHSGTNNILRAGFPNFSTFKFHSIRKSPHKHPHSIKQIPVTIRHNINAPKLIYFVYFHSIINN